MLVWLYRQDPGFAIIITINIFKFLLIMIN